MDQINEMPPPRRLFVAFEGGGAKGVVHVGALKAIEAYDPQYVGFAGTSAGSIVAALAAAGYKADDLVNPVSGSTLLNVLKRKDGEPYASAAELFGVDGWAAMQRLARLFGRGLLWRLLRLVIGVLASCVTAAIWGWATGFVMAAVLMVCAVVQVCRLYLGATRLDEFRTVVNAALAQKLGLPEGRHGSAGVQRGRGDRLSGTGRQSGRSRGDCRAGWHARGGRPNPDRPGHRPAGQREKPQAGRACGL